MSIITLQTATQSALAAKGRRRRRRAATRTATTPRDMSARSSRSFRTLRRRARCENPQNDSDGSIWQPTLGALATDFKGQEIGGFPKVHSSCDKMTAGMGDR
ncbi:hypothetical protein AOLI_G00169110 [Acnodon oligacanthus]